MSPLSVLSAAIVVLSLPWASTASCLCSISGDPHISTCDTKTNFAWQGAGAYSLFKTPDAELQCDFTYPQYDNGTVIHQMFTYVSSCRLSYKTPNGCEFTMLTGGNNDQQSIYIGNTKMTLSDVMSYLKNNMPSMGVNVDVDVPNARTTCTMQTQQGPIAFEIAPYQVHITTAGASQCNGLCGTCDGQAPLNLNLSDANSISTFATSYAADGSSRIPPIQLKPLPIGCVNNNGTMPTPSPNNGSVALGQNSTGAPVNSTPGVSTPLNSTTSSSNDTASTPSSSTPTAPGQTPVTGPGSPATTPGSSPASAPGSSPMTAPGMAPAPAPGSAPMTAPGQVNAPGSAPTNAPGQVNAPGSSPATAPGSIPLAPGVNPTSPTMGGPVGTAQQLSNTSSSPSTFSNGSMPLSSVTGPNGTQAYPTPAKVTEPNPEMVNDVPVFETSDQLRKVIDQCLCGQPKSRYYSDALFGRYFENCVYDKSFPGAEMLALSNMMTLHRTISKGFTRHNVSLAPLDMNTCKTMILERVVTKRPDQIPLGQGVSYIPIYTKQNSTGVMDLRPIMLTGTGEVADECEVEGASSNTPATPTRTWFRGIQPPAPTMVYTPNNDTQNANSSMTTNSTSSSDDVANTTSTN
jgi:hypothetical protein